MFRPTCGMIVLALIAGVHAQAPEPLYLQYDGWQKQPNGAYALSFGYFNYNRNAVVVPVGADNAFSPSRPDRNQPIQFQPGRRRASCVMVIDPAVDGKLQWTVKLGGRASVTTEKMLDPLYELDEGMIRRATEGLDLTSAPRGTCLNHAPWLAMASWVPNAKAINRQATQYRVKLGESLVLDAQVADDGLPRGSELVIATWRKLKG